LLRRYASDDSTRSIRLSVLHPEALAAMSRSGASRLMVADGDRLLGILTLKDLLRFFSLKMELEQAG